MKPLATVSGPWHKTRGNHSPEPLALNLTRNDVLLSGRVRLAARLFGLNLPAQTAGQVSEPFKAKYGWHVLRVDGRWRFAFGRVRPTLEFIRAKQKLEAIAGACIQRNQAYFKR